MAKVVTVNIKRCENCGVCETACAERHYGRARLKVKDVLQSRGLAFTNEVLPIICKQCEKPTCVEACKTNALKREEGIIHIDDEKCVGCGRCAKLCPFNAIFMEEMLASPNPELYEPSFLSMLFRRRKTLAQTARERKPKTTRRALKCDRCNGYESMACVDACYFRALALRDLNALTGGKREHAALLRQQLTQEQNPSET
jgi:Fe-S-cluster-containing hydrogenase component 2